MSDENEKIAIQFSEDTSGVNPSDLNLTTSGTVDKEVYHGADAVAQVEANIGRPLSALSVVWSRRRGTWLPLTPTLRVLPPKV